MTLAPEHSDSLIEINSFLLNAGLEPLAKETANQFNTYLSLLLRWNARMNLTAIRDVNGIISRHFIESIACARLLPNGIASLLDLGSGAGFPGVPIALCRPEIAVTLAESQSKKAAFLQEVVRTLALGARVFGSRAEELRQTFDCVILRAVDRMNRAISISATLVRPGGLLAILTTSESAHTIMGTLNREFCWRDPRKIPGSEHRILVLGERDQETHS